VSGRFLWELYKLSREFGVNSEELKAAAQELGRRRRGPREYNDDHRLAQMQGGASARAIASAEGGRGAFATETRISRKKRKQILISLYWKEIEQLTDLIVKLSLSPTEVADLLKEASTPFAPHLIILDFAMCCLQRVLDGGRLSSDNRDHVECARFHLGMVRNSDLDNPVRRENIE